MIAVLSCAKICLYMKMNLCTNKLYCANGPTRIIIISSTQEPTRESSTGMEGVR